MSRQDAKHKLAHYIGSAWTRAGLKWDRDNDAEVEGIVDSLIEAAAGEMRADICAVMDELKKPSAADPRTLAACSALKGLLANPGRYDGVHSYADLAADARGYADALLAELAKPAPAAQVATETAAGGSHARAQAHEGRS